MKVQAVLLDRDGVVNFDSPRYILSPEDFVPIPGSIEAMVALAQAGIKLGLVSNQSAVGRGWIDQEMLKRIHGRLEHELARHGVQLAFVGYCVHAPQEDCACRKPKPGLVKKALDALGVAPKRALLIGDSARDIEAAAAVGMPAWLVASGCKDLVAQLRRAQVVAPDVRVFVNLAHAVDALLSE